MGQRMEQGIDRGRTTSGLAYTKGKQSQREHGRGVDGNVFGHENGGELGGVGRGRGSWCCCGIIHRSSVVVVCYPMQLDKINILTSCVEMISLVLTPCVMVGEPFLDVKISMLSKSRC